MRISCRVSANCLGRLTMEPWSPGKVTGGLSSRSASATAAQWASCPPEASPMPTTILAGPARSAATSGT